MTDFQAEAWALRERVLDLSPSTVNQPTLVYFDIVGIGWPIRALLHLADIEHELQPANDSDFKGAMTGAY